MEAQIVGPSFHVGGANLDGQRLRERGNVLIEDLILQRPWLSAFSTGNSDKVWTEGPRRSDVMRKWFWNPEI